MPWCLVLQQTLVLQCIGVLAKQQAIQQVMGWVSSGNDKDMLGPAETFVYVLGEDPGMRQRLEVLRLHHYFLEELPRRLRETRKVVDACSRLMTSRAWRVLLHFLLSTGNAVNAHRTGGRAAMGFRLSSLSKFADMRYAKMSWQWGMWTPSSMC